MKPRLLDLFCGAGGAAMGYHRAGFEVVGVDLSPQKNYPFEFHQADAMTYPLEGFDAIHASPPCQGYSRMRHLPWLKDKEYPLLVAPCWKRFEASGVPFVIENVEDCWELPSSTVICGLTMGLRMYRHRRFGGSVMFLAPPHQKHPETIFKGPLLNARYKNSGGVMGILPWPAGHTSMHGLWPSIQAATGIDWMTREELTQAIPPAYTEFIGIQLLQHLSLNESKEN